jgi:putative DNA primase/helicase
MPDGATPTADDIVRDVMGEARLVLSAAAPLDSAREFVGRRYMAGRMRTLHHQADAFYIWTGTCYREMQKEEIRAELYQFLDQAYCKTKDGTLAPFNPNKTKVGNVLEALAAEAQLSLTIRSPAWLEDAA